MAPRASTCGAVEGGLLVQSWDELEPDPAAGRVATRRARLTPNGAISNSPGGSARSVKSNAIVLAKDGQVVGVGAGQMSRLDSVRIAVEKAGPAPRVPSWRPTPSSRFATGRTSPPPPGVTAIIQPGGSKRDDETIDACNEHGMAMILTGRRHFRH